MNDYKLEQDKQFFKTVNERSLQLKTNIEKDNIWIKEAGFLLRETKHHLILCSGWQIEGVHTEEQWCNVHKIPKTWIRKRKTLMIVN